jgi:thiamine biosynthesis lipoprotein
MATVEAPPVRRRVEHVMGMPVILDIRDTAASEALVDRVFEWLRAVDETFSTYKPSSEISRLGRGDLDLAAAHPDVRDVLDRCESLRVESCGYFDVFATGALDPSGLVKGWSIDRAGAMLEASGSRNFALYAGGDIVVRGRADAETPWRIGIQHPRESDRLAAVVEAEDLAIATSGGYARGDHVLDPYTGRPPAGVLSVTVVGPDLATADAYATAAFAMGARGPHWTARLRGYEAMTILTSDVVLSTPGFPASRAGAPDGALAV